MEELKIEVYDYLMKNHVGKNKMIKNKNLRFNLGLTISDKTMRNIIQQINDDETCIMVVGSISGRNGGFFICDTVEEIEETINNRIRRAEEMQKSTMMMQYKKTQMEKQL